MTPKKNSNFVVEFLEFFSQNLKLPPKGWVFCSKWALCFFCGWPWVFWKRTKKMPVLWKTLAENLHKIGCDWKLTMKILLLLFFPASSFTCCTIESDSSLSVHSAGAKEGWRQKAAARHLCYKSIDSCFTRLL